MYPVNEAFLQAVQENKELQMAKHNLERFLNQQEEEQKQKEKQQSKSGQSR